MAERPFGLLELGSNSLKFYLIDNPKSPAPTIATNKIPWDVAHDFFLTGRVMDKTVSEVVASIQHVEQFANGLPLSSMLALATGVFREIRNIDGLKKRVMADAGVRVRVITGKDEARLMAKDFHQHVGRDAAFLIDLGGATMEWAWFDAGSPQEYESLPLGAIRNEYLFRELKDDHQQYLTESGAFCDKKLASLPFKSPVAVIATGGTAKAAAACTDGNRVGKEQLLKLMATVQRDGPPASLKPARQAVFLPGLVILWRVLERCRAGHFTYSKASVRDGMAGRLVRLLGKHKREDLHATLLLNTRDLRRGRPA